MLSHIESPRHATAPIFASTNVESLAKDASQCSRPIPSIRLARRIFPDVLSH